MRFQKCFLEKQDIVTLGELLYVEASCFDSPDVPMGYHYMLLQQSLGLKACLHERLSVAAARSCFSAALHPGGPAAEWGVVGRGRDERYVRHDECEDRIGGIIQSIGDDLVYNYNAQ